MTITIKRTDTSSKWLSSSIKLVEEKWILHGNEAEATVGWQAYNANDVYVGDEAFAKQLIELGIAPEPAAPGGAVCCVGYSSQSRKWYGWSHRAMYGFTIGDRLFIEDYGVATTKFDQHGPDVIKTMTAARTAAVNFARYVG